MIALTVLATLAITIVGVADLWSTNRSLAVGGYEGNPIMRWVQDKMGDVWGIVKVLVHLLIAAVVMWASSLTWEPAWTGYVVPGVGLLLATANAYVVYLNFKFAAERKRARERAIA